MSTRSKRVNDTPALSDLEAATNPVETPGIMPPPGVEANVETRVRYTRMIDPTDDPARFSDELRELAGEEEEHLPLPEPPTDPLSEFCHVWQNYNGYSLRVTRLPDPANKRVPGQTYANTCFEITALGSIPFDPNNIVPQLQLINGDSGGVLRLFLADENGTAIPGARVDRILIPDPPKAFNRNPREFNPNGYNPFGEAQYYRREPPPPPQPPQKSETELYIEQMQRELFQKVMMRALDPPTPPTPDPLSTLSPDDRLALGLLQRGDILESAVNRIAALAQAPDQIGNATWKDKLADAGIQLVTHNPQIITTVTDIISRATVAITQGLANAFAARQPQVINEPIPVATQYPPPPQGIPPRAPALPQTNRQAIPGLPETPQDDEIDTDEDTEIDMMEDIVDLLLSERPLRLDDPVVLDLQETYPDKFTLALQLIAATPSQTLMQILCARSEICAERFNSSITGPHLRKRLEELKRLLMQPQPNAAPNTTQPEENNETDPT